MSWVSLGGVLGRFPHYRKLGQGRQTRRRWRSGGRMLWMAARRVVVRAVALWCVGLRSWSQPQRRIVWAALWERVRKAPGTRKLTKTAVYDPTSYQQNFDDGQWREEEDYLRCGSFAYRFGSGRFADLGVGV